MNKIIETWKPIPSTNGYYEASDQGRIRSLDRYVGHRWGGKALKRGKILSLHSDKYGYLQTNVGENGKRITRKVHRLVAEAFIDNPDNLPEVNHRDLNKANNWANNLEWSTRKNNQDHASKMGLFKGKTNQKRYKKVNDKMIDEIISQRRSGHTFKSIGDNFDISAAMVFHHCKNNGI